MRAPSICRRCHRLRPVNAARTCASCEGTRVREERRVVPPAPTPAQEAQEIGGEPPPTMLRETEDETQQAG